MSELDEERLLDQLYALSVHSFDNDLGGITDPGFVVWHGILGPTGCLVLRNVMALLEVGETTVTHRELSAMCGVRKSDSVHAPLGRSLSRLAKYSMVRLSPGSAGMCGLSMRTSYRNLTVRQFEYLPETSKRLYRLYHPGVEPRVHEGRLVR